MPLKRTRLPLLAPKPPSVVLIDVPQIVDLAANPHSGEYLARDVANVTAWFAGRGLPDAQRRGADLVEELRYEARLTG